MAIDLETKAKKEHRKVHCYGTLFRCIHCQMRWPCDAIQLADELRDLRQEVERLRDDNETLERGFSDMNDAAVKVEKENDRLREALGQAACDLSIALNEITNLTTHSERERVSAVRIAEFCHSQSEIARAALHTDAPELQEEVEGG